MAVAGKIVVGVIAETQQFEAGMKKADGIVEEFRRSSARGMGDDAGLRAALAWAKGGAVLSVLAGTMETIEATTRAIVNGTEDWTIALDKAARQIPIIGLMWRTMRSGQNVGEMVGGGLAGWAAEKWNVRMGRPSGANEAGSPGSNAGFAEVAGIGYTLQSRLSKLGLKGVDLDLANIRETIAQIESFRTAENSMLVDATIALATQLGSRIDMLDVAERSAALEEKSRSAAKAFNAEIALEARAARENVLSQGRAVTESLLTPMESALKTIKELQALLGEGVISKETFERGIRSAIHGGVSAGMAPGGFQEAGVATNVFARDFGAYLRAKGGNLEKQQLTELEKIRRAVEAPSSGGLF